VTITNMSATILDEWQSRKSPFIIAEAGVNHNGSLVTAKRLIDAAIESGADAVKFQTFTSENVVTPDGDMADYQVENTGTVESQLEMIKKLELCLEDFYQLKNYCNAKGIIFATTIHSPDLVDVIDPLVPFHKIGSGDLTNLPFLMHLASKNKLMILSTGMATIDEINEAVRVIKETGNKKIAILQCTTNYPADCSMANLRVMETYKKQFPDCAIGFSDHTPGIEVAVLAAKHGAAVIEKHFTLDKDLPGPDHKSSLNPQELTAMIRAIRNRDYNVAINEEAALGSRHKIPSLVELKIALVARKSIVANQDIPKGTVITEEMLIIKRPGWGLPSKYLPSIIGRISRCDISKNTLLDVTCLD